LPRHHQRISLQLSIAVQAGHAIDDRGDHGVAGRGLGQVLAEDLATSQGGADLPLLERTSRNQRAIGQGEEHGALIIDIEAFEELVEIRQLDARHHHPLEISVAVIEPTGNGDDPFAIGAAADGRADMRQRRCVLLMKTEIIAVSHILAVG